MNGHTWGGLRRILMRAGFACTIVAARPVSAADRTVCFDLRIQMASDIIDCGDANDSAVRRICEPGAQVAAIGQRVELWDKDHREQWCAVCDLPV